MNYIKRIINRYLNRFTDGKSGIAYIEIPYFLKIGKILHNGAKNQITSKFY